MCKMDHNWCSIINYYTICENYIFRNTLFGPNVVLEAIATLSAGEKSVLVLPFET